MLHLKLQQVGESVVLREVECEGGQFCQPTISTTINNSNMDPETGNIRTVSYKKIVSIIIFIINLFIVIKMISLGFIKKTFI